MLVPQNSISLPSEPNAEMVLDLKPTKSTSSRRRRVLMVGTINARRSLNTSSNAFVRENSVKASTDRTQNARTARSPRAGRPKTRRVRLAVNKSDTSYGHSVRAVSLNNPQVTFDDEVFINDLSKLQFDLGYLSYCKRSESKLTSPTRAMTKISKSKRRHKGSQKISPEIKQYLEARITREDAFAASLVLKQKRATKRKKSGRRRAKSRHPKTTDLKDIWNQTRLSETSQSDTNLLLGKVRVRRQSQRSRTLQRPTSTNSISPPSKRAMLRHSKRRVFLEVAKAVIEGRVHENIVKTSHGRASDSGKSPARSVEKIAALFEYKKRGSRSRPQKLELPRPNVELQATKVNHGSVFKVAGFTNNGKNRLKGPALTTDDGAENNTGSLGVVNGKQAVRENTSQVITVKRSKNQPRNSLGTRVNSDSLDNAERTIVEIYESGEILITPASERKDSPVFASKSITRRENIYQKENDSQTALKTSIVDLAQKTDRQKGTKKHVNFLKQSPVTLEENKTQATTENILTSSKQTVKLPGGDDSSQWRLNSPAISEPKEVLKTAKSNLAQHRSTNDNGQTKTTMGKNLNKQVSASETKVASDGLITPNGRVKSKGRASLEGKLATECGVTPKCTWPPLGKMSSEGSVASEGRATQRSRLTPKGRVTSESRVTSEGVVTSKPPLYSDQSSKQVSDATGTVKSRLDPGQPTKSIRKAGLRSSLLPEAFITCASPKPIQYVPMSSYTMKRSTSNAFVRNSRKSRRVKTKRRAKHAEETGGLKETESVSGAHEASLRLNQTAEISANGNNFSQAPKAPNPSKKAPTTGQSLPIGFVKTAINKDMNNSKDSNKNSNEDIELGRAKSSSSKPNSANTSARQSVNKLADTSADEEAGLEGEGRKSEEANNAGEAEQAGEEVVEEHEETAKRLKQSRRKKKMKAKITESVDVEMSSSKMQKPKPPPFHGWDDGKALAEHTMTKLPEYTDVAAILLQRAAKQKERKDEFLAERVKSEALPNAGAKDVNVYLAKHGIQEFFSEMTESILSERPKRSIEHMIEYTKSCGKQAMNVADMTSKFPFLKTEESLERLNLMNTGSGHSSGSAGTVDLRSINTEEVLNDAKLIVQQKESRDQLQRLYTGSIVSAASSGSSTALNITGQDEAVTSPSQDNIDTTTSNTTMSANPSYKSATLFVTRPLQSKVSRELVRSALSEDFASAGSEDKDGTPAFPKTSGAAPNPATGKKYNQEAAAQQDDVSSQFDDRGGKGRQGGSATHTSGDDRPETTRLYETCTLFVQGSGSLNISPILSEGGSMDMLGIDASNPMLEKGTGRSMPSRGSIKPKPNKAGSSAILNKGPSSSMPNKAASGKVLNKGASNPMQHIAGSSSMLNKGPRSSMLNKAASGKVLNKGASNPMQYIAGSSAMVNKGASSSKLNKEAGSSKLTKGASSSMLNKGAGSSKLTKGASSSMLNKDASSSKLNKSASSSMLNKAASSTMLRKDNSNSTLDKSANNKIQSNCATSSVNLGKTASSNSMPDKVASNPALDKSASSLKLSRPKGVRSSSSMLKKSASGTKQSKGARNPALERQFSAW